MKYFGLGVAFLAAVVGGVFILEQFRPGHPQGIQAFQSADQDAIDAIEAAIERLSRRIDGIESLPRTSPSRVEERRTEDNRVDEILKALESLSVRLTRLEAGHKKLLDDVTLLQSGVFNPQGPMGDLAAKSKPADWIALQQLGAMYSASDSNELLMAQIALLTPVQVLDLYGRPTRFDNELWHYKRPTAERRDGDVSRITFHFRQGVVTSIEVAVD